MRGFSQPELAFLLGWKANSSVSLLENKGREPKLTTAVQLELLFGATSADLFPKLAFGAEEELMRRAYELHTRLQGNPSKKTKQKLELLELVLERVKERIKQREA
jgi:transcriptional regulator with XRE-family HTH domain